MLGHFLLWWAVCQNFTISCNFDRRDLLELNIPIAFLAFFVFLTVLGFVVIHFLVTRLGSIYLTLYKLD